MISSEIYSKNVSWRYYNRCIQYHQSDVCLWIPNGLCKRVQVFQYSISSVGPGADPSVQAVSPQVTLSHPPGGRLPLLSARPVVTSPAAQHHRPFAGTKLYRMVTEAHRCEQLAQGCYAALPRTIQLVYISNGQVQEKNTFNISNSNSIKKTLNE